MIENNNSKIEIAFNFSTLSAQIKGINIDDFVWSQIYLLLSASSDNINRISKKTIRLPWFEFRGILRSFARYIKKENIAVVYDDYSKKLISNHLQDIISLTTTIRGKGSKILITDIKNTLSETSFNRNLTKEQLRNVSKLIALRHGANFSVPGAGKTSTLLAIHSILKMHELFSKLLVVSPRNAFISWEDEVLACFKDPIPEVVRLTSGKEKISLLLEEDPDIALITYHQLPIVIEDVVSYIQRNNVHLVLDEAHRIKRGIPGVHYSAVIKLVDLVSRRDILTGTPMPQSTSDLGPQFDFLWPSTNILTDSLKISDENKRIEIINRILKPVYVRTTKKELGLTPPSIKITNIRLGPVQSELYELARSEAARIISGMDREDIVAFRKLGRHVMTLLQIASNPMLITSSDSYEEDTLPIDPETRKWELLSEFSKYEKPAKFEYIIRRVRDICNKGNKVVVWSAFVRNIELLEKFLSDLGAVSIYGKIETGNESEVNTREWRIRNFHKNPNCKVLIANPAACGEGISLHKICHFAIYLDRTFNAAHYLQSVDRIHRLGLPQDLITKIEILQAESTIDKIAETRLKNKIRAMSEVLDDPDLKKLAYDPEDIIEDVPAGIDKTDFNEIQKHLGE